MKQEPELLVQEPLEPGGMWTCWVGDKPHRGRTRDDALFWAGWWTGRRQLQADVGLLVDNGSRASVELGSERTPCNNDDRKDVGGG